MDSDASATICFYDTFVGFDFAAHIGHLIHILCVHGSLSFTHNHVHYNVMPGNYVIFTKGAYVKSLAQSDDCRLIVMTFPEELTAGMALRSNYGIIGQLSLMRNPVMNLGCTDFELCRHDMTRMRERQAETTHLFRSEMVESLLKAHILDLYNIHARNYNPAVVVSSQPARIMRGFIGMLLAGDFVDDRSLGYYAGKLCVTPHYLSEISKQISGLPASYWIDRFVMEQTARMLMDVTLPLDEIAHRLNFSSVSYLSRYVRKAFGVTPSQFRTNYRSG